jgi:hypothetical protein
MKLSRGVVAETRLQWSTMAQVSTPGTHSHPTSHVSSVVCVAQWIQEGENHTHEFAGYAGTLKGLAVPGTEAFRPCLDRH